MPFTMLVALGASLDQNQIAQMVLLFCVVWSLIYTARLNHSKQEQPYNY